MKSRPSQYGPGQEIPERSWVYRLAKRFWFNDFGAYKVTVHTPALPETQELANIKNKLEK